MALSLTVLGCSGSYAAPGGACSGYLVQDGTTSLWMDCGPGSFANLQQHVDLASLDALLITHHHPDHWLELPVLRTALLYYRQRPPLALYGPQESLHAASELIGALSPPFEPHVLADRDEVRIGSLSVRVAQTDHPVETLAVRVDAEDVAFAYTSDTGPRFDIETLGDGLDVLLAEATLAEPEPHHVHLSGAEAGALAAAAGVRRLLLTHVPPGEDPLQRVAAAAATYDGSIDAVAINERYDL